MTEQVEVREAVCDELKQAIKDRHVFNVVGGCGIDTSKGESQCMDSSGVWFHFCPFCGRKIVAYHSAGGDWQWMEEGR